MARGRTSSRQRLVLSGYRTERGDIAKWSIVLFTSRCDNRLVFRQTNAQLPSKKRPIERQLLDLHRERRSAGVARLRVMRQQAWKPGTAGGLHLRAHLAGLCRRDARISFTGREKFFADESEALDRIGGLG